MRLEKPETWLHGVSVDRDVGFPDMPQLPPEHGVLQEGTSSQVSRSMPQNRMHIRRGNLTEIGALFCDVPVALKFLLLLVGFVPFFHRVFVFLMPPSKRFFWPVFIDRLAPSSPPTVS